MGTRHLTVVILNNETKIAQYGQWDGYPDGTGVSILNFLNKLKKKKDGFNLLKEKVSKLKWLSEEKIKELLIDNNWSRKYPYLSRDLGGDIIQYVFENDVEGLINKENFAGDSLFCEWGYVVDLDKNTFEVYEGFNKLKLDENDRFFKINGVDGYEPIKLVKSYFLFDLPTKNKFIKDFKKEDE